MMKTERVKIKHRLAKSNVRRITRKQALRIWPVKPKPVTKAPTEGKP